MTERSKKAEPASGLDALANDGRIIDADTIPQSMAERSEPAGKASGNADADGQKIALNRPPADTPKSSQDRIPAGRANQPKIPENPPENYASPPESHACYTSLLHNAVDDQNLSVGNISRKRASRCYTKVLHNWPAGVVCRCSQRSSDPQERFDA